MTMHMSKLHLTPLSAIIHFTFYLVYLNEKKKKQINFLFSSDVPRKVFENSREYPGNKFQSPEERELDYLTMHSVDRD